MVKIESSAGDLFDMSQNRFFIIGESGIHYSHNNGKIAEDPVLASMNFLNALDKIPKLIEKYISDNEKVAKDVPVLESVLSSTWKKEDELKELKNQLSALDRKIQLSLKPIEQGEQQQEQKEEGLGQPHQIVPSATASVVSHETLQTGRQSENFGQSVVYAAQPLKADEQSSFAIIIKTDKNSQDQRKVIKL